MNKYTAGLILGILGAALNVEAQALELRGLSPQDLRGLSPQGTDPMIFEYTLKGPTTLESDSIKTSGTIKSICASSEFDGQVYLEVSANGGTAYTKIINGTILTDGFIPGNELRLRATIADNSILKKIIIGYTDSSGVSTLYQNPDLKNYKYRKAIYISGGSEEVFNYPIAVRGQELRGLSPQGTVPEIYFTAEDGQTPLYYYIEQGLSPQGTVPEIFVKIPQIPKLGTMIYVYYFEQGLEGKGLSPQPTRGHSASELNETPSSRVSPQMMDPEKVFLFFDDFSGTILSEEKWRVMAGLKKECNIKDGNLALKDCMVISRNFKIKQGILEFKAKAENNCSIQAIVRGRTNPHSLFPLEQIVYSSNYPGAEHTIAINDMAKLNIGKPITPLTYYIYKVALNQDGIIFERYSENYEKQAEIKFLDLGNLDEGYIGLKADAAPFNAGSVYYDWVRVRPYLDVEPTVTSLSENEEVKYE